MLFFVCFFVFNFVFFSPVILCFLCWSVFLFSFFFVLDLMFASLFVVVFVCFLVVVVFSPFDTSDTRRFFVFVLFLFFS